MAFDYTEGLVKGAGLVDGLLAQGQKTQDYVGGMFDAAAAKKAGAAIAAGDPQTAAGLLGARGQLENASVLGKQASTASSLQAVNAGNYDRAKEETAAAGDATGYDHATAAQKQDRSERAAWLGHAADALLQIKDPNQRHQAYQQSIAPTLKAMGLDDATIAKVDQQSLTDEGLASFKASLGQLSKGEVRQDPNSGDLITVDPVTGKASVVYKAARKPEWKERKTKDADGNETTTWVDVNDPANQDDTTLADPTGRGLGSGPRNKRNNNPGNIEDGPFAKGLPGYAGTDGRFAKFTSPEAGAGAQVALLGSYGKRGIDTVEEIINRWAPPSDNNPTEAYVKFVSAKIGVKPGQKLDMADPATLSDIAGAIKQFEGSGSGSSGSHVIAQAGGRSVAGSATAASAEGTLTTDAVEQAAERYLTNGALPPLGMGKTATLNRDKILNKAAEMEKASGRTGAEAVAAWAGVKANTTALAQLTKTRSMVESFENTARKNADLMLELAPRGGGQTGSPVINRWLQAGRKKVAGDADVSNFDIALGTFADEYAKIVSGATGAAGSTDASRAEAYDRLSKYATQGQLTGGIATMKKEMANRITSLKEQEAQARSAISGKPVPAELATDTASSRWRQFSQPQKATAQKYKGSGAKPGTIKNPETVLNDGEFAKLKPGAYFIHPDGSVRVK